ncbi:MAG: hypothetical protein U1F24_06865 [Alphaproteobacteria bacterium]|jgi:hypothetical protein
MKTALTILGVLLLLSGLLWAGQGLGWIMWPKSSFMLAQIKWAYIGGATALAGLALLAFVRQRR